MPVRIHIGHHFFGAGNFGDDLMMAGFLVALERSGLEAKLTCCSRHDLASQQMRFPQVDWRPYTREQRRKAVRDCDVWLGLGDSPFQSDSGPWFLVHLDEERQICRKYRKPMYFLGVGVNNLEALELPQTVAVLADAQHIWTRDVTSAELLTMQVSESKVTAGADLAHIVLSEFVFLPPSLSTLGFVLHFEQASTFSLVVLQELFDELSHKRLQWLVQEVRRLRSSELAIFDQLPSEYQLRLELLLPNYASDSLTSILTTWGVPEVMLTSRYHATLMGAWAGSRILSVTRNQKVRSLVKQLHLASVEDIRVSAPVVEEIERCEAVSRDVLLPLLGLAEQVCTEFFGTCSRGFTRSQTRRDYMWRLSSWLKI